MISKKIKQFLAGFIMLAFTLIYFASYYGVAFSFGEENITHQHKKGPVIFFGNGSVVINYIDNESTSNSDISIKNDVAAHTENSNK